MQRVPSHRRFFFSCRISLVQAHCEAAPVALGCQADGTPGSACFNIIVIRATENAASPQPTAVNEAVVCSSEIMFIDAAHKWIRTEKLAASDRAHEPQTGVVGDPTKANAAMGKVFIDLKVSDAVAQIRAYRQPKP